MLDELLVRVQQAFDDVAVNVRTPARAAATT